MSSFRKNLMVGLTMLVGLVLFGYLLFKFGAAPAALFARDRLHVQMQAERASGLSVGSSVNYLGVNIGQVSAIYRTPDQTQVIIEATVDAKNPPPANVEGRIISQVVGGGSSVSLEVPDGKPAGRLTANAKIPATYVGVDLLPPEYTELATELRLTAQQLRKSNVVEHLDDALQTVNIELKHAGHLIDALDQTIGDPQLRTDLHASLANIRTATETANRVGDHLDKFGAKLDQIGDHLNSATTNADQLITKTQTHIDDVSKNIDERLLQVSKLLEQFQSIAGKIDQGKGTAGMLVNDPKLYESLVDTSKELTQTIKDLKLLVEQWTEEGVYLHLNK
jgi:phospholipid/cholesterol/gamma-HCH transport system substrate-binding protein